MIHTAPSGFTTFTPISAENQKDIPATISIISQQVAAFGLRYYGDGRNNSPVIISEAPIQLKSPKADLMSEAIKADHRKAESMTLPKHQKAEQLAAGAILMLAIAGIVLPLLFSDRRLGVIFPIALVGWYIMSKHLKDRELER